MKQHIRFRTFILCILITLSLMVWGGITPTAAQSGGTPPILLVVNDSAPNKFGRYLGEILRAEGLNSYDVADLSSLSASQIADYKVAILAETPLTSGQATLFSNYVSGGGYLIAMRPDAQIKSLFGLNTASGTQNNGYLKMSGTGPSQGLNTSTLQIHGTSDLYTTAVGAVVQAQLYSNATTATAYPSVVTSSSGHGTAFTYDLARNIAYTRQGNPANGSVDVDGDGVLRTIDLFQTSGGGAPWVDLNKVPVPQADEQQRLFARLVQQAVNTSMPMPQLWYFPGTAKTMLIPTGDAHANPYRYFQTVINDVNSHHGKMTVYLTDWGGLLVYDADLIGWSTQGNSFGLHPYGSPQPTDYNKLNAGYAEVQAWFASRYTVPQSRTVRNHQITWVGWTDAADLEVAYGMRMDANFYNWGPWLHKTDGSWAHGYITGSGQPMKFVKADGTILPLYQQLTQIVDEQLFPIANGFEGLNIPQALAVSQNLMDASEAGDYAALMTQFHMDYDSWGEIEGWVTGTVDYAYSKGIPIWNADQWLNFTETRHDANYTNIAWNNSTKTLSFGLNAATASSMNLSTIVPLAYNGSGLSAVQVDGANASYTIQTIKGVQVAFITVAAGNHTLSATYQGPVVTPTFTPTPSDTPTPTFTPTYTPTPGPAPTDTPPPAVGCFVDDSLSDFASGTNSNTFVSEVNGGQLILAPTVGENFSGSTLPSGWTANEWTPGSGGTATVSGGSIAVEGSRAGTNADYAAGATLESLATFRAAPWQHIGWVGDFNFNQNWAIFSTRETSNQLFARTSDGTNTPIAGNWIGTAHTYRIDRTATQAIFSIDGTQVAVHTFNYAERMRPLISDNNINGIPVSVNWLRVTPYAASGTFASRIFDAGVVKTWGAVNYTTSGSIIAISARTGNTPSPDGTWTGFINVASSGASLGLSGRYIQYRAALSTADTSQTPTLESIGLTCSAFSGNQPPSVGANQASVTTNEGQSASNTGTVSDPENNTVTLSASVGSVTNNGNGTWSWSYASTDGPAQTATVTISATDSGSASSQTTFGLTVNNVAPTATFSNASGTINVEQNATLTFSSPADASTVDGAAGFNYSYDCTNDGSFELSGSSSASFNCPYPTAGTITARGRIADKDGGFTDYTVDITVVGPTATPTATPTNTPVPVVGCFIDDTFADFSLGSTSSTFVSEIKGGQVILAPTVGENFDGSSLSSGWTAAAWSTGGTAIVSGDALSVENARAGTNTDYAVGGTLEFGATFGAALWQHVGWVKDIDFNSPWAIFSTLSTNNQLYTRTSDGTNTLIAGNWIGTPHVYRIDWTASQVIFSIDGTQVAVHNFITSNRMRPVVSDKSVDGVGLSIDWLTVTPYAASGTFTSRVFDAGAVKNWGAVNFNASGSSIAISARTGDTASPDGTWTGFTNVASSGASLGLSGRYIQYQAALSSANTAQTPALESIGFTCSAASGNQPPTVSANQPSVAVNEGQSASNTGTVSDPEGNTVTLSASVGSVVDNGNGTWSWSNPTNDGPAQTATVTISATDSGSASSQTTFGLTVNNVAPTATFSNASGTINVEQNATLTFSSPADASTVDGAAGFNYSYDCTNDGSFELSGSSSASFNCPYPTAGTITARGRIADKDGGSTDYTVDITVAQPTATPTDTPTATPTSTPTNTPVPPTNCFVDDTLADFSLGTNSSTFVSDVNGGQVILNPTLGQNFTGTVLPSGWASLNWAAGGSATVANSSVTVNGARAYTSTTYNGSKSLEFIATFRAAQSQQIGWALDSSLTAPWAVFSTFNTTNQLYARTSNGTNTLIPGNWIGTSHRFRINRTPNQMVFYIDGVIVATHALSTNGSNLRPVISDATVDSTSLTVDWLIITPYASSGMFTSRIYDAGVSSNWSTVTYSASGATVAISARTGNAASPDASWTAFTNVASSGSSLGLSGRYIQYQAVLSTSNTSQTPALDNISFTCAAGGGVSGQSIQGAVVIEVQVPTATLTTTPTDVMVTTPTDVPTATATVVPATEAPTATPTPTDVPPTPTLEPTATLAPTSTPVPPTATLAPPTAALSAAPDNGIAPLAVQFSSQVTGDVTSYAWAFGDGGTSADANPAYTFAAPGTYTVVLTVSGPGGSASAQIVITVSS